MATERIDVLAAFDEELIPLARGLNYHTEHAEDLAVRSRAAVSGLLEAIDRVFHEWDNIGPALDKLRYARSLIGAP